jgi:hypothetical protein
LEKSDRYSSLEFWNASSDDDKLIYINLIEKYMSIKIDIDSITEEQIELIWSIQEN